MVDFSAITSKSFDEIERPKPAPVGHYLGMVESYEFDQSREKKTPYVRLHIKLVQPQDDVDEGELAEAGGMEKIGKRTLRQDFFLTEDAMFRLKDFFNDVLQLDTAGKTISDLMPEVNNQQVLVEVNHYMGGPNKDEPIAQVQNLLPVE